MKRKLRVAVAGAAGRMGKRLTAAVAAAPDMILAAAVVAPGKAGGICAEGVAFTDAADYSQIDALIDFTRAAPSAQIAAAAAQAAAKSGKHIGLVVGATGHSRDELAVLKRAAKKTALVLAPNTGVAANVMFYLLPLAARALQGDAFGDDFDLEIFDAHHRAKQDAPSGTALQIGAILARARGQKQQTAYPRRAGARKKGEIGYAVARGGGVIGEHTVFFLGDDERLEITHRAINRDLFAAGALKAARFAASRPPGLYHMQDVLGLK